MHSRKFVLFVACLGSLMLFSLAASASSESAGKSSVGTWKLDLSKSTFSNTTAPKFEQIVVNTDDADYLKWNLKGVMPDGKSYIESYDGPIDGKDHEVVSINGSHTIAYTRTQTGLQWVMKDANGNVVETGAGEMSADGKTLALKGTITTTNGKSSFTAIFNRAQ